MTDKEYFCPILHTCPHWIDKCYHHGCQHPEAIAMREEDKMTDKPWKPDWVSIGIWAVVIIGCLIIWFKILSPIVSFLK